MVPRCIAARKSVFVLAGRRGGRRAGTATSSLSTSSTGTSIVASADVRSVPGTLGIDGRGSAVVFGGAATLAVCMALSVHGGVRVVESGRL